MLPWASHFASAREDDDAAGGGGGEVTPSPNECTHERDLTPHTLRYRNLNPEGM